ncbi:MAG: hypothetical protein ABIL09_07895 [Gemmatimonadota bacterium]
MTPGREGDGAADPLAPRLFGYGLLYRVALRGDALVPAPAAAASEATALAAALSALASGGLAAADASGSGPGSWCASVPFGRCGIDGRPREHVRLWGASEAYHEILGPAGYESRPVEPGQTVTFLPGLLHRLRARGIGDGRVLVAFQTEDRTPLSGHAAPVNRGDQAAPTTHPERLLGAWAAFEALRALAGPDPGAYQRELARFFGRMANALSANPEMARIQAAAAAAGAYDAPDQDLLFRRQSALLIPEVLERVAAADPELFRFPGMFGAVAPLFSRLDTSPR